MRWQLVEFCKFHPLLYMTHAWGGFSQDFKEEITFLETLQIEKYM